MVLIYFQALQEQKGYLDLLISLLRQESFHGNFADLENAIDRMNLLTWENIFQRNRELQGIEKAINSLIDRMGNRIVSSHNLFLMLHELRTPITVIKDIPDLDRWEKKTKGS